MVLGCKPFVASGPCVANHLSLLVPGECYWEASGQKSSSKNSSSRLLSRAGLEARGHSTQVAGQCHLTAIPLVWWWREGGRKSQNKGLYVDQNGAGKKGEEGKAGHCSNLCHSISKIKPAGSHPGGSPSSCCTCVTGLESTCGLTWPGMGSHFKRNVQDKENGMLSFLSPDTFRSITFKKQKLKT